jgi:hypothetical protein
LRRITECSPNKSAAVPNEHQWAICQGSFINYKNYTVSDIQGRVRLTDYDITRKNKRNWSEMSQVLAKKVGIYVEI